MPAKLLVIGLDSADRDLLEQWIACGDLPVLRTLAARSARAAIKGLPGFGDDAVWPSLYTGVSPARHGRYFYVQVWPGSYVPRGFKDSDLQREPFWNVLSRAGRRVAIVDVPKSPVSTDLNGIQVVDWLAHGHDHAQVCTWPPSLAADLTTRFGAVPPSLCEAPELTFSDYQILVEQLLATVNMKAAASCDYLDHGNWDLFLTVFKESHCVGHRCWHVHDPTHPKHDRGLADTLGDPVKRIYQAIDSAIGRLLERITSETTVIVLTQIGMGPKYTAQGVLDAVLLRLETGLRGRCVARAKSAWKKLPLAFRRGAAPHLWSAGAPLRAFEHRHRKCFTVENNDFAGAIRVNVAGREPDGRVRPGREFDAYCAGLTRDLLDLVNVDTGAPVVQEVCRPANLYRGEYIDRLPDLLAIWNCNTPIAGVRSPTVGTIMASSEDPRSGNHLPHGVLYACGPGIGAGHCAPEVSVMDIAPTLAAVLGTELPDVDGSPIAALLGGARP